MLQEYAQGIAARHRMLELIPPGNVILLRPFKVHCTCQGRRTHRSGDASQCSPRTSVVLCCVQKQGERSGWDAVWVKAEEIIREGILISPAMANDHYAMTLEVQRDSTAPRPLAWPFKAALTP